MNTFISKLLCPCAMIIGLLPWGVPCHAAASETTGEPEFPASMATGTLPTIYIQTENNIPILDKETKVPAGFHMVSNDPEKYDHVGSEDEPVALTIKGRGNSSWMKAKKPYKLKFDKKTSLFGLPKNKHYVLLAQFAQHTWLAYEMGFEISRNLGMKWTPRMIPVELVLNGQYEGIYFLCESVKIANGRLDINEQEDGETDSSKIPYGWLIEIDNTDEENQVRFNEDGKSLLLRFTFKSPEELSAEQLAWIEPELKRINSVLYSEPDEQTEKALSENFDVASFVQYFIVREILNDFDGYSGSFYIHRDNEDNPLWTAGPMWDLTLDRSRKEFYMPYDPTRPTWSAPHWIGQFMKYQCFEDTFKQLWGKFYTGENLALIRQHLDEYASGLQTAFDANNIRWEKEKYDIYNNYTQLNADLSLSYVKDAFDYNTAWIDNHRNLVEYANTPEDILTGIHSVRKSLLSVENDVIEYHASEGLPISMSIMDLNGHVIKTTNTNAMSVTDLPAGVYLIYVCLPDGQTEYRKIML